MVLFVLTNDIFIIYVNKYYSPDWRHENTSRVAPYEDEELSFERINCLKRYFPSNEERHVGYAKFSTTIDAFADFNSLCD